jgi:hypothetical protein
MKYVFILLLLSVFTLSACTVEDIIDSNPLACTEEAKVCDDGSSVARDPNNNCEFRECPTGKMYVSADKEQCLAITFQCDDGMQQFFDDVGCGCEPGTEGKLQAFDCPVERQKACTREYMPVCGQVQIQCITTPCDPIKQTFSNKCEACANELTISYTEGACKEDLAGGTVLAGTLEEQCVNIGGTWTGYDCTGIDLNQCQEIGGTFNECASACRNDPTAEMCTLQCVFVCEFK